MFFLLATFVACLSVRSPASHAGIFDLAILAPKDLVSTQRRVLSEHAECQHIILDVPQQAPRIFLYKIIVNDEQVESLTGDLSAAIGEYIKHTQGSSLTAVMQKNLSYRGDALFWQVRLAPETLLNQLNRRLYCTIHAYDPYHHKPALYQTNILVARHVRTTNGQMLTAQDMNTLVHMFALPSLTWHPHTLALSPSPPSPEKKEYHFPLVSSPVSSPSIPSAISLCLPSPQGFPASTQRRRHPAGSPQKETTSTPAHSPTSSDTALFIPFFSRMNISPSFQLQPPPRRPAYKACPMPLTPLYETPAHQEPLQQNPLQKEPLQQNPLQKEPLQQGLLPQNASPQATPETSTLYPPMPPNM